MLAGRLPEIFFNETIVVIGASATTEERREYCSTWKLLVFAKNFPNTEVVKVSYLGRDKLLITVYDDTAQALAEGKYDDVRRFADEVESHTFTDDRGYIKSCQRFREENPEMATDEYLNNI